MVGIEIRGVAISLFGCSETRPEIGNCLISGKQTPIKILMQGRSPNLSMNVTFPINPDPELSCLEIRIHDQNHNTSKVPSAQFNFRGTGVAETTCDDEPIDAHEVPRRRDGGRTQQVPFRRKTTKRVRRDAIGRFR